MKHALTTKGYLRAILLSLCAAVLIEGIVNADEVKAAFVKEKNLKKATVAIKPKAVDLLCIPQNLSGIVGSIYYSLFS